ncbi:hypothetical protein [Mesorhizobium sp. L-2-11]|uniref:hypothetical protein n=1 Tax=Mesorhizobium sp. L-2-11 TaxID=2744521 RepID=UPI00192640BB|nr:hypothetical protein [Mesorhizobium sp. L-2-11]
MDTPSASAIVESLIFCASALRSPDDLELIHDLQRKPDARIRDHGLNSLNAALCHPSETNQSFFAKCLHLDVEGSAAAHAKPVLAMNDTKAAGDDDGSADDTQHQQDEPVSICIRDACGHPW